MEEKWKESEMQKGKFISFEGIDNCGKTTQIKRLEAYLKERDIPVMVAREPGGTALGETLRKILKHPEKVYHLINKSYPRESDFLPLQENQKRTPISETLLFLTARAEFMHHLVLPNLEKGITVIADRLGDSTRAYQGGGRYASKSDIIRIINALNDFVLQERWPDKTFFLDIPYEVMIQRSQGEELDYMEKLGRDFFERTRREYQRIALENPRRVISVDGTLSQEAIFNHGILPHIKELYHLQ